MPLGGAKYLAFFFLSKKISTPRGTYTKEKEFMRMKKVKSISPTILPLGAEIVNIFLRIFSFIENKFEAELALSCFSFAFS